MLSASTVVSFLVIVVAALLWTRSSLLSPTSLSAATESVAGFSVASPDTPDIIKPKLKNIYDNINPDFNVNSCLHVGNFSSVQSMTLLRQFDDCKDCQRKDKAKFLLLGVDDISLWRPWGASQTSAATLSELYPMGPLYATGCSAEGCQTLYGDSMFNKGSRQGRMKSLPVSVQGSLVAIDLDKLLLSDNTAQSWTSANIQLDSSIINLELMGLPDFGFHPGSISSISDAGLIYAHVINHRPENSVIDSFLYDYRNNVMNYLYRTIDALIQDPYDIVGISSNQFLISNFYSKNNYDEVTFPEDFEISTYESTIVLCTKNVDDGNSSCNVSAAGLKGAAGMVMDRGHLFVADLLAKSIVIYQVSYHNEKITGLLLKNHIPMEGGYPDRLSVDTVNGDIIVTVHRNLKQLLRHRRGDENALLSPTTVMKIHWKNFANYNYILTELLKHPSGLNFSAASSVLVYEQVPIFGASISKGLWICPQLLKY